MLLEVVKVIASIATPIVVAVIGILYTPPNRECKSFSCSTVRIQQKMGRSIL